VRLKNPWEVREGALCWTRESTEKKEGLHGGMEKVTRQITTFLTSALGWINGPLYSLAGRGRLEPV